MPVGNVQSSIASQIEEVGSLNELVLFQSVLFKRIEASTEVTAISNRPARIPFQVSTGGQFRTGSNLFDGGSLGRGSAPVLTYGNLSAVSFLLATEYTALAEYSTDSTKKSVENFVTLTNTQAAKVIAGNFDSLIANSDGSNTLDTVVSTSGTNGLVVNNADIFQDNQPIDCYSALTGAAGFLGTVTIQSIDSGSNTIWLTAAFPAGVGAGTLLLANGSAGLANSGLFGIPYYHAAGGNFMGIPRTSWAGKFTTPTVNPGTTLTPTGPITPLNARAMLAGMKLAMGAENAGEDMLFHCNVDVSGAWEANALAVQNIVYNQMQGDESADMLKKRASSTIAGRETLENIRAIAGRLDGLTLKNWFRMETKSLGQYEVGGQSVFTAYAGDGGLESSMLSYQVAMFQIGLAQPREECYMPNITIGKGYFGH